VAVVDGEILNKSLAIERMLASKACRAGKPIEARPTFLAAAEEPAPRMRPQAPALSEG